MLRICSECYEPKLNERFRKMPNGLFRAKCKMCEWTEEKSRRANRPDKEKPIKPHRPAPRNIEEMKAQDIENALLWVQKFLPWKPNKQHNALTQRKGKVI